MVRCIVFGCNNSLKKERTLHRFPVDPVKQKQWVENMELSRFEHGFKPTQNHRICSNHFEKKWFYIPEGGCRRRLLHQAVPTILPTLSIEPLARKRKLPLDSYPDSLTNTNTGQYLDPPTVKKENVISISPSSMQPLPGAPEIIPLTDIGVCETTNILPLIPGSWSKNHDPNHSDAASPENSPVTETIKLIPQTECEKIPYLPTVAKNLLQLELPESYFNEVCRICLSPSKVLIPIHEIQFTHCLTPNQKVKNVSLIDVLHKFCQVQISTFDGKPQHICEFCTNMSSQAFNFFQLFLNSNNFLDSTYPHLKNSLPDKKIVTLPGIPEVEIKVEAGSSIEEEDLQSLSKTEEGVNVDALAGVTENAVEQGLIREDHNYCGSKKASTKSLFQFMCDLEVPLENLDAGKRYLRNLQQMRQDNDAFTCLHCDLKIQGLNALIEHGIKSHMRGGNRKRKWGNCVLCKKSIIGIRKYKYHIAIHSPDAFVCNHCEEYFETKDIYDNHNAEIDHVKGSCKICNKKIMPSKRSGIFKKMRYHLEVNHRASDARSCPLCGKIFKYITNLDRHIRSVHEKQKFMCQYCDKPLQRKYDLRIHIERNHPEKVGTDLISKFPDRYIKDTNDAISAQCQLCDRRFANTHSFYVHTDREHDDFREYACQICPEEFPTFKDLRKHQFVHPQYQCKKCSFSFVLVSDLRRHRLRTTCGASSGLPTLSAQPRDYLTVRRMLAGKVKRGPRSFRCKYCLIMVRSWYQLYKHSANHPEFKEYACEVCEEVHKSMMDLKTHYRASHANLCCPQCDMFFGMMEGLRNHIQAKHRMKSLSSKSQCTTCGVILLGGKQALADHMNIHTGQKPFVCEMCGNRFRQDAHLRLHMYQHDPNRGKPYKCKICSKRFNFPSTLKTHIRTHTGEKPYVCLYCTKTFKDNVTRHRHIKKSHLDKDYEYQLYRSHHLHDEIKKIEGASETWTHINDNSGAATDPFQEVDAGNKKSRENIGDWGVSGGNEVDSRGEDGSEVVNCYETEEH
ncbi:zinc finger protein 709-like isoform X2 [Euwallacea fornicatus]|uniref:zinc finger protein 709-like isoform X2 n=1 Tax=Euwallacea fornicatus TaxID=995702 RepID=UPI00338F8AFD